MKTRLFIGAALAVAVVAGLWMWSHWHESAVKPIVSSHPTRVASHQTAPGLKIFPSHSAKMVAVTGPTSAKRLSGFNPLRNTWSTIQTIVDRTADYQQRFNAIGRLPARLTAADWAALQQYLLQPNPVDAGQLGQVLKNQLLDALCAMQPPPAGLADVLIQMYQDHSQDEVIRDYAVQHLATLYEEHAARRSANAAHEEQVQKVLWGALQETDDSIAGTALLGLERSAQAGAPVNQNRMAEAALKLAGDPTAGELTHITAYAVCGQLNAQAALPAIQVAAQNGPTVSEQAAAIGALGLLGGAKDLPLLQQLVQGNEERLKLPAQTAISRIEQRFSVERTAK